MTATKEPKNTFDPSFIRDVSELVYRKQTAAQEPTFFTGSSFAVVEIELSLQQLTEKVRSLKQGNTAGSAVQQKLASEDVSKISKQITMMADLITRTTLSHINRRPR